MEIFKEPWTYIVIDNFYPDNVFKKLQAYAKNKLKEEGFGTNGSFRLRFERDEELNKILKQCEVSPKLLKYFPDVREHTTLNVYTEINAIIGPYKYKLHDEAPNKILSLVVYIDPVENRGTRLFTKDKTFCKEIEWRQNRAFIFCGVEGVTWHDYLCNKGDFRITINQFLEKGKDYD
jgi:hypothetical protein|tara:strand:+ start:93 stop:623 length:531 start_codon:yes stop_codon:yes gene_type:complete